MSETIKVRFSLLDSAFCESLVLLVSSASIIHSLDTVYIKILPAPTVKHKPVLSALWGFYSFEGISVVWSGLMWSEASAKRHVKLLRVGRGQSCGKVASSKVKHLRGGSAPLEILTSTFFERKSFTQPKCAIRYDGHEKVHKQCRTQAR